MLLRYPKLTWFETKHLLYLPSILCGLILIVVPLVYPEFSQANEVQSQIDNSSQLNLETELDIQRSQLSQEASQPVQNSAEPQVESPDLTGEYLIPPTKIKEENLLKNLTFTTIPLNNTLINHSTQWEFNTSILDGSIGISGLYRLDGEVVQSISQDNVITSEQTATYLQTQPVIAKKTIEIDTNDPVTILGFRSQTSLIGSCSLIGKPEAGSWCTLVPGLRFDETSIDPENLVPTRTIQTSKFGDPVPQTVVDKLFEPGFQDSNFSLNIYVPNAGNIPGNSQSDRSQINRDQITQLAQPLGLTQVRQVFKANATEQKLARNRRGFWVIPGDNNLAINTGVQGLTRILPQVNPSLPGSPKPAKGDINLNLFQAAHNFYIPNNSLTVYTYEQGGAANPQPNQPHPPGKYSGFWIGLSPIGERSITSETIVKLIGSEQIIFSGGGEGGANPIAGNNFCVAADEQTCIVANINGNIFTNLEANNQAQVYLDLLARDANQITRFIDTREYKYFPSLTYSYNKTTSNESMGYLLGAIFGDEIKAYIGADYNKNWSGLNLSASARLYTNPDLDYQSQISLGLSKSFRLGTQSNLLVFLNSNYVFGGAESPLGEVNRPNTLALGVKANLGNFSLGATQYVDGILPESTSGTQVNLGLKLGKRVNMGASAGLINGDVTYGLKLSAILGNQPQLSILEVGFDRSIFDYGEDSFGHNLQAITDNYRFKVGVRFSY
jgi:hypothetical protein